MDFQIDNLVITGGGFIGTNLRKHFEAKQKSNVKVWQAGRSGSENSVTSIVENNKLTNFGVILNGWGGVTSSSSGDSALQTQSLREFEAQIGEIKSLSPLITLGFGSQIEKSGDLKKLTSYAAAKIEARKLFANMIESSNLLGKWIYIYSVYGPDMNESWLLPQLIIGGAKGSPLNMGQCLQKWGFLHISDFSDAIELIISMPHLFPFEIDLGGDASNSLRELVYEVEKSVGFKCANFTHFGMPGWDSVPDLRPLTAAGWAQRVTLNHGVQELRDRYA